MQMKCKTWKQLTIASTDGRLVKHVSAAVSSDGHGSDLNM